MRKPAIPSRRIQGLLLRWFEKNGRDLPWRRTRDPYAIWVSEIMLQQTQVKTVIPYYRRFLTAFPTVRHLAGADLSEVLRTWEGLGYYSRARNLHQASKIVVNHYEGRIPDNLKDLLGLPGIGRSTAGGVLSFGFDKPAPILDGNARRVLSRLYVISGNPVRRKTEDLLWEISESLIPKGRSNPFNQALMDLGSMICTPRDPQCPRCPARNLCRGYLSGKPERYPLRAVKKALPHITACSAVIEKGKRVLLRQRLPKGLLGGLWEFPNWKTEGKSRLSLRLRNHIKKEMGLSIEVEGSMGVFRQTFSHFKLTLHVYRCRAVGRAGDGSWVPIKNLPNLPMSRIHRRIANSISDRRLQIEKKTS